MAEKLTGEINLTHNLAPDLKATVKHTTDDYSRTRLTIKSITILMLRYPLTPKAKQRLLSMSKYEGR